MTASAIPPAALDVAELEAACRRETERYRNGQACRSQHCLELFVRATRPPAVPPSPADRRPERVIDEEACAALVRLYGLYVRAQLVRFATPVTSIDDLEQQVWLRFWQAASRGLTFTSLPAALSYLKRTAASVRIEAQQQQWRRQREQAFPALENGDGAAMADASSDPFDEYVQRRVRARVTELLTEPLEERLFRLRYDLGFPPREIARRLAAEGVGLRGRPPTARAVSDLLERLYRRLCQDRELRDLLGND